MPLGAFRGALSQKRPFLRQRARQRPAGDVEKFPSAHGDGPERVGWRVNNIGPYTTSNKPNAAIQHVADRARRSIKWSGFQDAQTRVIAAALMRRKIATVARLAVRSRSVCPSVTRGITARIMVAMAPAVSAWIAEATGAPAPRIESPRSVTPITSQA